MLNFCGSCQICIPKMIVVLCTCYFVGVPHPRTSYHSHDVAKVPAVGMFHYVYRAHNYTYTGLLSFVKVQHLEVLLIIGQAGVSSPSRTTSVQFYIHVCIFPCVASTMCMRALRANVRPAH